MANPIRKKMFDQIFKKFPIEQQKALMETLLTIEDLFPFSKRAIAWGMPTLKIGNDNLVHVMGFKNHNSIFPSSGSIAQLFEKDLQKYEVTKGSIHFPTDKPFPKVILKKLLLARLEQINSSYPKKNGEFVEYYKNGGIKSIGKYRGVEMNGLWNFFRLNGTLMRTGSFKNGVQYGVWKTYDSQGKIVKESNF